MIKNLLLIGTIAITFAGCKKKTPVEVIVPEVPPVVYTITEGFENSTKTAYATGTISSPIGPWTLNDALVGSLAGDLKEGTKSIRLRNGSVTMNYDLQGMKMLYIKHGKYGTDANSTWQLLVSVDTGKTFTQVGADIQENNTSLKLDSFQFDGNKPVRFQIRKTGTTRINIDDVTFKGTGDPGIGSDSTITEPEPGNGGGTPPPATTPRGVTAGPDAQPASGDNSNALFGNPSSATTLTPDNFLIDKHYYIESYSSTRGTPNWVSWHLEPADFNGASDRLDNFAGFTGLPTGAFQVQSNSYSGSGFDRGHNVPSADRTSSTNANSATFLMTNMIPQAPQNNQQTWNNMEQYLRTQAVAGNEVYIIMGSYGSGGSGSNGFASTIANGKVTVPSNVWKVAVIIPSGNGDISRVSATTRVIAVNTPNINTIDTDWKKYRVSVRDIEAATGYDLLSSLPKNIQDAIETVVDNLN
ncbi:DNA/RNA non-specific endonuclease [Pedobacter sp. BAL39]|uniref:DNA/RNA non-specific endonuclease n=1 Tax=Pedobacter sp. BAL39 TaxID=391596 RepID=UPI000155A089|nr:DNA/RNA non-specific endonuclease [Pedobacter sp. BAL39]EDM34925.1 DNA/RNA non-specific endonuclease [Pedobacter sp. BAL39]